MEQSSIEHNVKNFHGVYLGGLFGWIMAIWDLTIMVLLVVPLSSLFFPGTEKYLAVVGTISIYVSTSVFRSAGGFIFGRLGDRIGRKKSLSVTLLGIGISTALTGFVPTYAQAGIYSIVILILLRVSVGLFAGGEYGNSATMVVENAPPKRRGLWGALTQIGFPVGFILAATTYLTVLAAVGDSNFAVSSYTAGWRIVFWAGIIPAVVGVIVRVRTPESALWEKQKAQGRLAKAPFRTLFGTKATRNAFFNAWIGMTGFALAYWLTAGFLPVLLPDYAGISFPVSLYVLMAALLSSLFAYLIIGWLSDVIGRKRSIFLFSALGAIFAIPMLYILIGTDSSLLVKAAAASALTFTATGVWGIFPVYLSEKFPTEVRDTGVGSSFNSGFLIGAWGSTFALMLAASDTGAYLLWSAGGLIIAGLVIAALTAALTKETGGSKM